MVEASNIVQDDGLKHESLELMGYDGDLMGIDGDNLGIHCDDLASRPHWNAG